MREIAKEDVMEGGHEEATTTPQEPSAADGTRRPSLSERLMNPGAFGAAPPREPQPQEPAAAVELRSIEPERSSQPVSRPMTAQRAAFADLRFRVEPVASDALKDARRFIRVRYYSFLGSMALVLATLIVAVVVLGLSLANGGAWEVKAASGAVAAGALFLLILLQYNPAAGFASAAAELAQVEALRGHLERSYALWDAFLEDGETRKEITAHEIALAVSSMTSATRELVAAQAELTAARRSGREATASAPKFPSPSAPDPRRY
jgi:hypothetical protein